MKFSTRQFHYSKGARRFTADCSDLRLDQLPTSFWLVSHKTGLAVAFKIRESVQEHGEIVAWVYRAISHSNLAPWYDLEVQIVND